MLSQYIENIRIENTDDAGREPLFTSRSGRLSKTAMRRSVYRVTSPCFRGDPCPECAGTESEK